MGTTPGARTPALVSESDYLRTQQVTALAAPEDGTTDPYQLTGLVICGLCGRRAEGHWAHGRARYRCRHGYTSPSDAHLERPKIWYVRQDQIVAQARVQLAHLLDVGPEDLTPRELDR
ncbi:zinc ribbon domain-containing protein [Actinoplanes sp. NPDC051346]|uniref:zinc ribbon domain-containing protein n=1 Tax=Actinoplanes sp. NPDC051346 TaxID=3155048 RepID=UPI00342D634B